LVAAIAFAALSALGGSVRASDAEEYNRLSAKWSKAFAAAKYREAEELARRTLPLAEGPLRDQPGLLGQALDMVAQSLQAQGKHAEAEPLFLQALAIFERIDGAQSFDVAVALNNLALLYYEQGKYAQAEPLYQRAQSIFERVRGPGDTYVADCLNNLAGVASAQGRLAEAERLQKKALTIYEKARGPMHSDIAYSLNNLANFYNVQGRYDEAEPLYLRAVQIKERSAPDHPDLATSLSNLAALYYQQGRYEEAEKLDRRGLAIREKVFDAEHWQVAVSLHNIANNLRAQGRYAEAEPMFRRGLAIKEKQLGPNHADVAYSLYGLANTLYALGRFDEAEPLVDRAITIRNRAAISARERMHLYVLKARLLWRKGQRQEAVADLQRSIDLAEEQRGLSAGSEQDLARSFAEYTQAFEQMIDWRAELGDTEGVLAAIERMRARSLLDQIELRGADLLAGLPAGEARELRKREADARGRIAQLEGKLNLLDLRQDLTDDQWREARKPVLADLQKAREEYHEAYRDIRTASPIVRLTSGQSRQTAPLAEVQARLAKSGGLLLEYAIGADAGYVVVVPPSGPARIVKLEIGDGAARTLGVDPGPLTRARLRSALVGEKAPGVVLQIEKPGTEKDAAPRLAALWQVLVPEEERQGIVRGDYERLVIVPDATLGWLPFEALVVQEGEQPKYLLDVDAPVVYAPSATVFLNLAARPAVSAAREPVITVGDPAYGAPAATGASAVDHVAVRTRFRAAGGRLNRLPYSGVESHWVLKNFQDGGSRAVQLLGAQATEAAVRAALPGRRYVHLACHGLADTSHGNLFGALALSPGRGGDADPADDGFLTLAEIYELNLAGCELAILSACDTNFGPMQRGEGTWALSRGFVVAGARRVVASNWLVDDQAAATLVSYFCTQVAKQQSGMPDYVRSLQTAKRWVRRQEKWRSPYFWATFVLVGAG
jgi:CHAT domain-containing protein/tetratricopeptide (TPR) repeat protein